MRMRKRYSHVVSLSSLWKRIMAVVGTKLEVMREGNANVAVKTEQVLDMETGLLLERKTVIAAVSTGDGKADVIAAQKISLAAVQPRPGSSQHRAIAAPPTTSYGTSSSSSDNESSCMMHAFCCISSVFFPPCLLCWIWYCCNTSCKD